MNFDVFFKKTLCLGKLGITFAYELGLKSFLYEKVSERKVTSEQRRLQCKVCSCTSPAQHGPG
jgi:hypothetical protein